MNQALGMYCTDGQGGQVQVSGVDISMYTVQQHWAAAGTIA